MIATNKRAAAIEALGHAICIADLKERIAATVDAIVAIVDARLADYLRAPEAEGGGTKSRGGPPRIVHYVPPSPAGIPMPAACGSTDGPSANAVHEWATRWDLVNCEACLRLQPNGAPSEEGEGPEVSPSAADEEKRRVPSMGDGYDHAAIDEFPLCNGCGKPLRAANYRIADGCPCNTRRGINHGLVPTLTCTCAMCDPAQTGSTRWPAADEEKPKRCATCGDDRAIPCRACGRTYRAACGHMVRKRERCPLCELPADAEAGKETTK